MEGAAIDPITGDFYFSTFGGANQIIQVRGFTPPVPPAPTATAVPTLSTWAIVAAALPLLFSGLVFAGKARRGPR